MEIVQVSKIEAGKATAEQIAELKEQHGVVYELVVEVSEKEFSYGYLKEPERIHLAKVMGKMASKQPVEAGEELLKLTWLDGDKRMLGGDKWIAFTAALQASELIEFKESRVKKL